MDKQTYYLDTCILIGYLKNKDDIKKTSEKIIGELKGNRHPNIIPVIPHVVLGEAISEIIEIEREGEDELVDSSLYNLKKIVEDVKAETPFH